MGSNLKLPKSVADLMVRNPRTVRPDSTVADAYQLMFEGGFRHLPVVEGERAMGMLSDRDILKHMPPPSTTADGAHAHGKFASLHVREIMSQPALSVLETDPLSVAIEVIIANQVSAVLATDAQERLRGILTLIDLAQAFLVTLQLADGA